MIIGKISAQNSAFGLKLGTSLQEDINDSKHKLLNHINTDARSSFHRYFKANLNYLKSTLPEGNLELININHNNGNKVYILSDGKGEMTTFLINGTDSFYGKLANKIRQLRRSGEFRQKPKVSN